MKVNRKLIIYYMPTFRTNLEANETRVKSGFHKGLGAKTHWNFRFNAAEPLWHHTRVQGTHNRCFKNRQEILESLRRVFHDMQRHPESISGYLRPFQ